MIVERLPVSKPRRCQSLVAWDRGDHIELSLLVIPKEQRGQGIGTEVVLRLKRFATEANKPIKLKVDRPHEKRLKRFYEKCGFRAVGGLEMVWVPEGVEG